MQYGTIPCMLKQIQVSSYFKSKILQYLDSDYNRDFYSFVRTQQKHYSQTRDSVISKQIFS